MLAFTGHQALLVSVILDSMLEDCLLKGPGAMSLAPHQLYTTGVLTVVEASVPVP